MEGYCFLTSSPTITDWGQYPGFKRALNLLKLKSKSSGRTPDETIPASAIRPADLTKHGGGLRVEAFRG